MSAFRYFLAPTSEMAHVAGEPKPCVFCGAVGDGFELEWAICPSLSTNERIGKHGCLTGLAGRRFGFEHNTDIGVLGEHGLQKRQANHREAPTGFRAEALQTLLHTPDVLRWQYEPWLTCCDEFMAYMGPWQPSDFVRNAKDGDGRARFLAMTRDEGLRHVWDACCDGKSVPRDGWRITYYVYRCLHCSELQSQHLVCDRTRRSPRVCRATDGTSPNPTTSPPRRTRAHDYSRAASTLAASATERVSLIDGTSHADPSGRSR